VVDVDVVEWSLTLLVWIIVALLAWRIYKKQEESVKAWKIVLLMVAGLFSFSVNFPNDGGMIRLAVLPLGVMILSFVFRKKKESWSVYRKYAWLGFFANYIFLATSLLSSPIHSAIYPADQADTYIAEVNEPALRIIHPSGEVKAINEQNFEKAISKLVKTDFPSLDWYYEVEKFEPTEPKYVVEKFPYVIDGIEPKWGSGIRSIVYLEKDGKGILISSPKGQYYFRSEHVMFEEGDVE